MRCLMCLAAILAATVAVSASDDARLRMLYGEVIAPCCWSQPVSQHQSPAAEEVRASIRRRVAEGWSDEQIKDALVAQYGVAVLARPPARGFTRALYVAPWLVLAGSGIGLSVLACRGARRRAVLEATPDPDPGEADRLDEALRDLD
jgi:cytochrome c-type biogenesis protein CcmH